MDQEDGDGDGAGLDVGVDGDSGGGMEEPSGGDSGSVSPLRSSPAAAFCLLFRVFRVSPPPPHETPRGTLFIVGFRSRRSHGDENGRHRSHEGEKRWSYAARESDRVGPPILGLGPPMPSIFVPVPSS